MEISFRKNFYDQDGDLNEECILLHFDNIMIVQVKDLQELKDIINQLQNIKKEIQES